MVMGRAFPKRKVGEISQPAIFLLVSFLKSGLCFLYKSIKIKKTVRLNINHGTDLYKEVSFHFVILMNDQIPGRASFFEPLFPNQFEPARQAATVARAAATAALGSAELVSLAAAQLRDYVADLYFSHFGTPIPRALSDRVFEAAAVGGSPAVNNVLRAFVGSSQRTRNQAVDQAIRDLAIPETSKEFLKEGVTSLQAVQKRLRFVFQSAPRISKRRRSRSKARPRKSRKAESILEQLTADGPQSTPNPT